MRYPTIKYFEEKLSEIAPYMASTVENCRNNFGQPWEDDFENTLQKLFSNNQNSIEQAARGYVHFAVESIMLQKRLGTEKCYNVKSYEEASEAAYSNSDYMLNYYLPANLLIHYIWPHHYYQVLFFRRYFIPEIQKKNSATSFCDIGVGSGFYSRILLGSCPSAKGTGFDISDFSLSYTDRHIGLFGYADRWRSEKRDIVDNTPDGKWDFAVSVEILEHLVDPASFLRVIRTILREGGLAYISAAVTAAQRDHIYLYKDSGEVEKHLIQAGFEIVKQQEYLAYPPKAGEPVPKLAAFIVR